MLREHHFFNFIQNVFGQLKRLWIQSEISVDIIQENDGLGFVQGCLWQYSLDYFIAFVYEFSLEFCHFGYLLEGYGLAVLLTGQEDQHKCNNLMGLPSQNNRNLIYNLIEHLITCFQNSWILNHQVCHPMLNIFLHLVSG